MSKVKFNSIPYSRPFVDEAEMRKISVEQYQFMDQRRTVRNFSDRAIHPEIIDHIILSASTAPSGAHKQPWTFCIISDPAIKKQIRIAAEKEEKESYKKRMNDEWLQDLQSIGTDWHKPFLEIAPYLIIIFKHSYELDKDQNKHQNYYVIESCGIATGFLLAAIHQAGLVALTHTPSPMSFLSKILNRPENEKPFMLIPVGYPADECEVPDLKRKSLEDVIDRY